jgi:nucleotidyltransferase substrate binding protein (TIGR01987 family)
MTKEEINYSLNKLNNAFTRLSESIKVTVDDLDKDGVIQRFEFTVELFWKTLKIILESEGVECRTPKECLQSAFKAGFIEAKDEEIFLDMLVDRNKTSHLYNQDESEIIFERIKNDYVLSMEKVLKSLLIRNF